MPNIKSKKKRVITNAKANERNKAVRSELKTASRKVDEAVAAGDSDTAKKAAADASRLLDRAASKGVIHKNQAANRKSTLTNQANRV